MSKNILTSIAAMAVLISCDMFVTTKSEMPRNKMSAPSSLPSQDYNSNVWTDSRGCKFIRISTGTWAPKVTQTGTHICTNTTSSEDPFVAPSRNIDVVNVPVQTAPVAANDVISQAVRQVDVVTVTVPSSPAASAPKATASTAYVVQVGFYSNLADANRAAARLSAAGYKVSIVLTPDGSRIVKVTSKKNQTTGQVVADLQRLGFRGPFSFE